MIDYDTYSKIKAYHNERGLTVPQIAGELGLDPRTVQDWVDAPRFRQRQVTVRPSKLDPFKNTVAFLAKNPSSIPNISTLPTITALPFHPAMYAKATKKGVS